QPASAVPNSEVFSFIQKVTGINFLISDYSLEKIGNEQVKHSDNYSIAFSDLSVIAPYSDNFRLGFVLQVGNSTNPRYLFQPGDHDFTVSTNVLSVILGLQLYVGAGLLVIGAILFGTLVICCSLEDDSNRDSSAEEESDSQSTP